MDKFDTADNLAFNTVKPALEDLFKEYNCTTKIIASDSKCRTDLYLTATTATMVENYYTMELKNRWKDIYSYSNFVKWENAYETKPKEELTKLELQMGTGQFINEKKLSALLDVHNNGRRAYFAVYFSDGVLALWRITPENAVKIRQTGDWTEYGKTEVIDTGKENQFNYHLKLKDADFIYDAKNKRRIKPKDE